MKVARAILIAGGLGLLAIGGLVLLLDVPAGQYLGILVWFAAALVIHDGIVAPVVVGVSLLMRRAGRRVPFVVIAIVQGSLVIAALMTAIVVPEMLKQRIGSANDSILPLPYGTNLVLFYAGLAVVTAASIAIYLAASRQKRREPSDQL